MRQTSEITVISILGARPQFIKAAAVCRAVLEHNQNHKTPEIKHILVHTGQHYDDNMSRVFFKEMDIPHPDYNLGIGSASHGRQTGNMMVAIEDIILKKRPDWVLVYGDTNTTLAGALVSAKLHIPVAHIEGGLRSFNRKMPEEINRVLTDHISDLIFCPTANAVKNLVTEGIKEGVRLVGDVMYDCALYYANKAKEIEAGVYEKHKIHPLSYYLATVHRAENTDDPVRLKNILSAFGQIATSDCPLIFPIHPRTLKTLKELKLKISPKVQLTTPVSYMKMVALEKNSKAILTDSGGVQKEAYFYQIPCITLRNETEWVETVENKANILAGTDPEAIINAVSESVKSKKVEFIKGIYGNGDTSKLIIEELIIFPK